MTSPGSFHWLHIMMDFQSGVVAAFLTAVSSLTLNYISDVQPTPYMDEIFHVPQVQKYCQGNFSAWDPMITTLPGLYLITVGVLGPVQYATSLSTEIVCSTFSLRIVNVFFCTGNLYVIYCIYLFLHTDEKISKLNAALGSLTLGIFPVLYFFTFLYYTDPGSTFFVLMMYLFYLHNIKFISALSGILAISFRQTNIIWVVFMAGLSARTYILNWINNHTKEKNIDMGNDRKMILTLLSLCTSPVQLFTVILRIFFGTIWYIVVVLGFAAFVYINGSIVVGDKSHHEACLNFPQIFYFLFMCTFFSSMHLISPSKVFDFMKFAIFKFYIVIPLVLLAYVAIWKYTYVHIYLLSDNRHYTFYIWSKIFERHPNIRYLFIPVYVYTAWSIHDNLSHKDIFWRVVYTICLCASTVPQKLLEFRYFIVPYLILRLNMKSPSYLCLVLEVLLYTMINVFTIYMYTLRPFKWPDSEEWQRFMW